MEKSLEKKAKLNFWLRLILAEVVIVAVIHLIIYLLKGELPTVQILSMELNRSMLDILGTPLLTIVIAQTAKLPKPKDWPHGNSLEIFSEKLRCQSEILAFLIEFLGLIIIAIFALSAVFFGITSGILIGVVFGLLLSIAFLFVSFLLMLVSSWIYAPLRKLKEAENPDQDDDQDE